MLNQLLKPVAGEEIVVMTTDKGTISMRLFPEIAPKAVENFKELIKKGYYDGIIFHRVIPDFMIQGGDPTGTGRGGESIFGQAFEDEFHPEYRNFRGALSMANAGPNTNGSQFFIVQKKDVERDLLSQMRDLGENQGFPDAVIDAYEELGGTAWLDFRHTVFGQVFDGMDVVDAIAEVERDAYDKPLEPVRMITVELKKYE